MRDILVPMCYATVATHWVRGQHATEDREGRRYSPHPGMARSNGRPGEARFSVEGPWKLGRLELRPVGPALPRLCHSFPESPSLSDGAVARRTSKRVSPATAQRASVSITVHRISRDCCVSDTARTIVRICSSSSKGLELWIPPEYRSGARRSRATPPTTRAMSQPGKSWQKPSGMSASSMSSTARPPP